jgi:tetratricopeptide (TPR) repeat protein
LQEALLRLNDGEVTSARAEMEQILKDAPDDIQVLEALATSYAAVHDMPGAIERLRQAASGFPPSAPRQLLLGNWLLQSGDAAGARAAFDTAQKTNPGLTAAPLALAELDVREKKLDAARNRLAPLFASNDRQVCIQANLLAGGLEASAGNSDAAIRHFRKVVELDKSHVVALEHLAGLLADSDAQIDEALQMAQKAVELSPADPEGEDTLGWILFRKGMYPLALKHLEFASAPSARWRHKFHLSMVYFRLGERQKATVILSAALKQKPDLSSALSKSELSALGTTPSRF